jgi:subtilisin family serine protease
MAMHLKSRSRLVLESASRSVVEQLEGRQLLSGSVGGFEFASITWGGRAIEVDQGRYLAQAKAGKSFEAIAAKQGFEDVRPLGGGVYAFSSDLEVSRLERWGRSGRSGLTFLEPSRKVAGAAAAPADPLFADQYSLENTGQLDVNPANTPNGPVGTNGTPGADISLLPAWDIEDGSVGAGQAATIVAVLDTGIDLLHPDLVGAIYVNAGEVPDDGLDNDGNGYIDDVNGYNTIEPGESVQDGFRHGTHVSGIIAATSGNGIGISGISKGAQILTVKVLGDDNRGTDESIIAGINYVVDFASRTAIVGVMNLSLGGVGPLDAAYQVAFSRAKALGIVSILAAGNDSADNDARQIRQTPLGQFSGFVTPQRFSEFQSSLIVVAATDNKDQLASFSNIGKRTVAVGAPGVNILSTVPVSLDTNGLADGYQVLDGTSFASPTVAGIAALLKAYRPTATADQVADAIRAGVDILPSLNGNGLNRDKVVSTGGRVNAEKALRALVNNLADSSDSVTRGNWKQPNGTVVYGRDGSFIVGQSVVFPSFVTGVFSGHTTTTVSRLSGSRLISAPLADLPEDFSTRSLTQATAANGTVAFPSFNVDMVLAGDATRRVSLYMADLTGRTKQQTVTLTDNVTGLVLETISVSNLKNGQYLTLDLTGNVKLTFTGTTRAQPVLNAIFFDTAPGSLGVFANEDRNTGGRWLDVYGTDGDVRFGSGQSLPSYATVTTGDGATSQLLRGNSRNRAALENLNLAVGRGDEAFLTGPGVIEITATLTGSADRVVTLYMADYNRRNRVQRVEVLDPTSGALLDTRVIRDFRNGVYVSYVTSSSVRFRVTNLAGDSPVVSGVFFDSTLRGSSVVAFGTDSVTRGDWRGNYGSTAAFVAGAATQPFVAGFGNDVLNGEGGFTTVLSRSTRDKTALLDPNSNSNRVSGVVQNANKITLDVPLSAGETHTVSLYMADLRTLNRDARVMTVTVTDEATGDSVSRVVRDFARGKYVSFIVTGPVTVEIARVAGSTAIYSGLFID